jgi:hypothetical protein
MMTGFYLNTKRFKNHLKIELENQFGKRKGKFRFFSPSCPSFRPERPSSACLFLPAGPRARPSLPSSLFLLGWPSLAQQPRRSLPSLSG